MDEELVRRRGWARALNQLCKWSVCVCVCICRFLCVHSLLSSLNELMWCSLVLYSYIICLACLITHSPLNAWPNNAPSVFQICVCTPQTTALFLLFDCTDGNDSLTKVSLDRNESMIITFGTSSHYTENKFCGLWLLRGVPVVQCLLYLFLRSSLKIQRTAMVVISSINLGWWSFGCSEKY